MVPIVIKFRNRHILIENALHSLDFLLKTCKISIMKEQTCHFTYFYIQLDYPVHILAHTPPSTYSCKSLGNLCSSCYLHNHQCFHIRQYLWVKHGLRITQWVNGHVWVGSLKSVSDMGPHMKLSTDHVEVIECSWLGLSRYTQTKTNNLSTKEWWAFLINTCLWSFPISDQSQLIVILPYTNALRFLYEHA